MKNVIPTKGRNLTTNESWKFKIMSLIYKFWAFRFLAFARNDNALLVLGQSKLFFYKEELQNDSK